MEIGAIFARLACARVLRGLDARGERRAIDAAMEDGERLIESRGLVPQLLAERARLAVARLDATRDRAG